ncbi:MAG: DUF1925 domain-containing protein, partial [Candidatus Omnitrophica bacterium]|nr:DUF1925 domain-containing protein [Candidatus Omnitrophota bacterium]
MIGENKGAVFAMAFHCHQPVDNFGWEFEHAYSGAYLPLLEKFEEFAGVKGAFHFSGSVLEWIEKEHPEYISRMSVLIARGQVEIIGGGCYEPVMSMIPETDRLEQIKMNDGLIRRLFGCKTRGVWLAEKVWEPFLAGTLKKAGAEYTIVDDYHILRAGYGEEEAHSPCCHDSGHGKIILFPSHTRLRYYMPFKAPEVTIEHMRGLSSDPVLERKCFFFADDGEKFGAWPYTFWWVHKKGWLRQFFERLSENSSWLTTATYSEVLDGCAHRCVGEVPSSSYAEMMEWSGGDFRNFLSKYPESGRMHARMTSVSTLVKEAMDGRVPSLAPELILDARREVFKAQANCAYWHGTFGGVYLPHLRAGVYRHLITAENLLEDPPCDGRKGFVRVLERSSRQEEREILFRNDNVDIFLSPGRGGAITEFDDRRACVNLMNNLSRIPEGYHDKLKRSSYGRIREARKAIFRGDYADVHYVLGIKDRGLSRELAVDAHRRYSFLTHISAGPLRLEDMPRGRGGNARFLDGAYTYS